MKIAIAASGQTLADKVVNTFEESPFLIIYETETGAFKVSDHDHKKDPQGLEIANLVVAEKCEALLTGEIEEKPFYIIADQGITRFKADGMTVSAAIPLMEARKLAYIRDYKGAPPDHHHHD